MICYSAAVVHAGHISIVAVDYTTISMYHDDSCCGLHNSTVLLDGMESFLNAHISWRREHGMVTREGFPANPQWRKVPALPETSSQQDDSDSCGIFTCWHATARVLGIVPLHFKNHHVPQIRLQIYHCFAVDLLFIPHLIGPLRRYPAVHTPHSCLVRTA